jgi:hypothetical protein
VFALHNGTLFHLMFMPSVKDFAKAKADVEELYQSVMASFSFLPGATGKSLGTVQLLEPAPNAQIDGSPILRWAKVPGAAQYKLVIMEAATTQIAFDLVFTDTGEIVLVVPPPLPRERALQWTVSALAADRTELARASSTFTLKPPVTSMATPTALPCATTFEAHGVMGFMRFKPSDFSFGTRTLYLTYVFPFEQDYVAVVYDLGAFDAAADWNTLVNKFEAGDYPADKRDAIALFDALKSSVKFRP